MRTYQGFRIHQDQGVHRAGVESLPKPDPAEGEVLIRVRYSAVNYKDALAGTGRGKILRTFPLTGGVDGAGAVEASRDPRYREGDMVLVTGWGLSFDHDGGFAEYLCCPGEWLVPVPSGLDVRTATIHGSAGFTAALALHRMLANGQRPGLGPILVTGASGGVGSIAVAIFARLGYEVVAVSGKPDLEPWLGALGASRTIGRDALSEAKRPLERAQWGGAVDNAGGDLLAQITRTIAPGGNIASIGLAGGTELHTTVMPFILRGASLLGVNSVDVPREQRLELWSQLAGDWAPQDLDSIVTGLVRLEALPEVFERMLAGQTHGRILVEL